MLQQFIDQAQKRAEQVEVFQVSSSETPVRFDFNRLKGIDTSEKRLTALRLIKDGRLGFATTTNENYEELLDAALTTARFGRAWDLKLPDAAEIPEVSTFDSDTAEITVEQLAAMGNKTLAKITKLHPEVLASVHLTRRESLIQLLNSNGISRVYKKTGFNYFASAELTQSQNFLAVYAGFDSAKLDRTQVAAEDQYLTETFKAGQKNVALGSGNYTVIFTPQALTDVLRPFLASVNGKAVEKGFSPWKNKVEQTLLAPQISLYDDATHPWGPASCPFDGEGIPTSRLPLIEKGVLRNFLLDLTTAKALNMRPTGNGFRAQAGELPSPSTSNIILESSETMAIQQLTNVKRCIIIHSLMGAWAGNPYSGQVSGNIALGFLMEDGQVIGRIKDCMVAINAFVAFQSQIDGVSTEKEWAYTMHLPFMRFSDVAIAAKK